MTTKLDRLAAPFPESLVSWRPGSAIGDHKRACDRQNCRETKDPTKHMQFAYVEDEAVMDRLDEVLGLGGWQWRVEAVGEGVVRGSLLVQWDAGGEWCTYQDFGYAGNGSEALKEASTDAFRRCGRMVGIARYIYAGELEQAHRASPPRPEARTTGAGSPRPAPVPPDDPVPTFDDLPAIADGIFNEDPPPADFLCPDHNEPWKHVPAGTSKTTGRPYGAFWACPERGCKARPSEAWVREQEA